MSVSAAPAEPAPAPSSDEALQRAMIKELAVIAMNVARSIGRQVEAAEAAALAAAAPPQPVSLEAQLAALKADPEASPPAPPAPPPAAPVLTPAEFGLSFDRAARAARRCLGLWLQVSHDGPARAAAQARVAREARLAQAAERRVQAERIVARVALDHYQAVLPGEGEDAAAVEAIRQLSAEARERLEDEGLYGDLADRPLSESIARLCAELGLSPDWPRLAQEHWARAELAGAAPGAPLAAVAASSPPARPQERVPAQGPPLRGGRWRRRQALRGDPQAPPQTRVTVRFVEHDGTPVPARAAPRPAPPAGVGPPDRVDPPDPPDTPAESAAALSPEAEQRRRLEAAQAEEEAAAAAALAARMEFAEYGPRGAGQPSY